jgi:hypothetical protein
VSQRDPEPVNPMDDLRRQGGGTTSAALSTRDERVNDFLKAFALCGSIRKACEVAAVSRRSVHRWREEDEDFASRFEEAQLEAADRIREAMHKAGVEGWEDEIYDKEGNLRGKRWQFSPPVLIRMAEANCPEYRRRLELSATADAQKLARDLREASMAAENTVPAPTSPEVGGAAAPTKQE